MKFLIYVNENEKLMRLIQFDDFDKGQKNIFAKILKCREVAFTAKSGGRVIIHPTDKLDFCARRYLVGRHASESLFFDKNYIFEKNCGEELMILDQVVDCRRFETIKSLDRQRFCRPTILPSDDLKFLDKKTPTELKTEKMLEENEKEFQKKQIEKKKNRLLKSKNHMAIIHFLREFKKFKKDFRQIFEKSENDFYKKLFSKI